MDSRNNDHEYRSPMGISFASIQDQEMDLETEVLPCDVNNHPMNSNGIEKVDNIQDTSIPEQPIPVNREPEIIPITDDENRNAIPLKENPQDMRKDKKIEFLLSDRKKKMIFKS